MWFFRPPDPWRGCGRISHYSTRVDGRSPMGRPGKELAWFLHKVPSPMRAGSVVCSSQSPPQSRLCKGRRGRNGCGRRPFRCDARGSKASRCALRLRWGGFGSATAEREWNMAVLMMDGTGLVKGRSDVFYSAPAVAEPKPFASRRRRRFAASGRGFEPPRPTPESGRPDELGRRAGRRMPPRPGPTRGTSARTTRRRPKPSCQPPGRGPQRWSAWPA